nr:hypothetical protein [Eubacterium sp.]
MSRQTTGYVYGSAARQLQVEPARRIEKRPQRQPQRRPQPVKRRVDKGAVALIIITFAIAFSVCFGYLRLQFQTTYMKKHVVQLENEVVEMEKQNATELQKLEESVDLGGIYKKATKELGMKNAKNNQIYTYESKKSTQVRLHGK